MIQRVQVLNFWHIDPQAQCYIFDTDSADYMLTKLDMDMLKSG